MAKFLCMQELLKVLLDDGNSGQSRRLLHAIRDMLRRQPFALLAQRLLPLMPDQQLADLAYGLLPGLTALRRSSDRTSAESLLQVIHAVCLTADALDEGSE